MTNLIGVAVTILSLGWLITKGLQRLGKIFEDADISFMGGQDGR